MELRGSIRLVSFNKGNTSWKSGVMRIYCQEKWKIAIRFSCQQQDQFTWTLKNNVRKVNFRGSQFWLEMRENEGSIRMSQFISGDPNKFKELIEEINSGKKPPERGSVNQENVPRSPLTKPVPRPTPTGARIPLSPKQTHTTKTQGKSDQTLNPANSSARKNFNHFLEAGKSKSTGFLETGKSRSAEKLTKTTFYGNKSNHRTYGALGVSSVKRLKRPGLLPDPEHRQIYKRARSEYEWTKKPVTPTKTELQGFSNLGNTCYMNAILQSLFHLPTFADDLLTLFRRVKKNRGVFPSEYLFVHLATLVQTQKSEGSYEKKRRCLSQIKNAISASAKRFSGYEQHDAHEFLGQVLDQLKEETIKLNKVKGHDLKVNRLSLTPEGQNLTPEGHSVTPEGPSLTPEGQDTSPTEGRVGASEYDNPTIKNFEFTVLHTITCLNCGEEVHKEETFHDLSLDIPRRRLCPGDRTLQDALDLFFRDEQIEYKCEDCGGTNSHVHHKFTRLPRILIMHLKRYNLQPQGAGCGKSGGEIGIPRFITLQSHCTEMTSPPFPPDLNTSFDNESDLNKYGKDSPTERDETPRRRLFEDRGFKRVRAHVQLDAARSIANSEGATSDCDIGRSLDEVKLLSENLIMVSTSDDETLPEFTERYTQPLLAQVDGTVDPRSPEKRQEESMDEEEIKQLNEDEQLELALQRSMREVKSPEKQSTESSSEEADRSQDSPKRKTTRVNNTAQDSETQSYDMFEDCATSPEKTTTEDAAITVSDDESSGQENIKPQKFYTIFRNQKTPMSKTRVSHSTPKVESETSPKVKSQSKETNNIDDIANEIFENEMTNDVQMDFENDLFEDEPEKDGPEKDEKKVKLLITDSDDNGTIVLPSGDKASSESDTKEDDKENVTPPHIETTPEGMATDDKDWLERKQKEDLEKEELEFQRALQMSLQEQEDTDQREKDEMRRATELSLQEMDPKCFMVCDSDDEPYDGSEAGEGAHSKEWVDQLQKNARTGELPYSYRLVSVVSHLGSSSQVGHYVSDVLDIRKKMWSSYDDSHVSRTRELEVCMSRNKSGYVFFYCAKELVDELEELYQHNLDVRTTS